MRDPITENHHKSAPSPEEIFQAGGIGFSLGSSGGGEVIRPRPDDDGPCGPRAD